MFYGVFIFLFFMLLYKMPKKQKTNEMNEFISELKSDPNHKLIKMEVTRDYLNPEEFEALRSFIFHSEERIRSTAMYGPDVASCITTIVEKSETRQLIV